MASTPHQTVKKNFESRAKLVEQLVGLVDKQNGDSTPEQVKSRLMGLPNKKLVRLYQVEQKVREKFGTREKMLAHIVDARKKAGLSADAAFQKILDGYTKARLLDMTKMTYAAKATKQTPEQRLAKKRGRKAKERALSKLKK